MQDAPLTGSALLEFLCSKFINVKDLGHYCRDSNNDRGPRDEPAALVGQVRCEDSNDEDVVSSTCRVARLRDACEKARSDVETGVEKEGSRELMVHVRMRMRMRRGHNCI
jgi:hypothetical protein